MTDKIDQQPFREFELSGEYQDGQSSRSLPARLRVSASGCKLITDELQLSISPRDLKLTDRISNTPRRITWGEPACFITTDNDGADELRKLLPGNTLASLPFKLESYLPLAFFSLAIAVALLGATLLWGIPSGARYLAFKLPDSVRETAARQSVAVIDETWLKPSKLTAQRKTELTAYFRSINDYPPEILFRDGEQIGANAFALPGGYVVFTDQLVELAESDTELLGVYLHEVGHARLRHAETSALQSSGWLVLLTLITGDVSGMSDAIFTLPVTLGQMAFSREMEREADDFAIEQMLAAKLSPQALAAMLQRLESGKDRKTESDPGAADPNVENNTHERSTWLEYMSSHPATAERLARIRAASTHPAGNDETSAGRQDRD